MIKRALMRGLHMLGAAWLAWEFLFMAGLWLVLFGPFALGGRLRRRSGLRPAAKGGRHV